MLVANMTNEHLENTIKLFIKRIKQAIHIINWTPEKLRPEYLVANVSTRDIQKQARDVLRISLENLPKYIFEATVRGISFSKELQDALDRTEKIEDIFKPIDEVEALWYEPEND